MAVGEKSPDPQIGSRTVHRCKSGVLSGGWGRVRWLVLGTHGSAVVPTPRGLGGRSIRASPVPVSRSVHSMLG